MSAVAIAGALGSLPLTWRTPDEAKQQIAEVQSRTSRPFIANYVLNFSPASLDSALAAGVRIIQFSWGLPDAYMLDKLRAHGVKMGIQVSDGRGAERALACHPDFLICQGVEAGGHVQGNKPLMAALAEVLAVAGAIPVAASGASPRARPCARSSRPARQPPSWGRASSRHGRARRTRSTRRRSSPRRAPRTPC